MGCCQSKKDARKRDRGAGARPQDRDRGRGRDRRHERSRATGNKDLQSEEQIAYQVLMRERPSNEPNVCVATFPYQAGSTAEIDLEKGDRVELLEQKDDDTEDFVFVRVLKEGGKIGYVATNFLAPENTIEAEDYYFGPIKRRDALRQLRSEDIKGGSYLVRNSETRYEHKYDGQGADPATQYVLSVKDNSSNLHHYRMYDSGQTAGKTRIYISQSNKFDTIQEMITFYSNKDVPTTEICCRLTTPVRRPPPIRKFMSKEMMNKWREIPREQIETVEEVGSGNFGKVYKGLWKPPDGKPIEVAVKQLKDVTIRAKDMMFKEAAAMRHLSHKNIVRLYGVVTSNPCCMITEYVKDGSLKNFLQGRRHDECLPPLPDADLIDIATQICRGMAYLESKEIVHRDLAARNVLINKMSVKPVKIEAKICDFGLARCLNDSGIYKMARDTALPQQWLSPEAFKESLFTTKSDVWAFGCTLCELFSEGRDPFDQVPQIKLTKYLKRGERPTAGTKNMRRCRVDEQVFRPCTRARPEDRPSFAELLITLESLPGEAGD